MKTPISDEEYIRIGMRMAVHLYSKEQREGQAAFNALCDVRPDVAEEVRGSDKLYNPFYDNSRLEAFWTFITSYGDGIPITFNGEDADDHMTIDAFCQYVADGSFIDYDGFGCFATATHYDPGQRVKPSDIVVYRDTNEMPRGRSGDHPEWATHVVWFNK